MNTFRHIVEGVNNDDDYTKRTAIATMKLVYQVSCRLALDIGGELFLKSGPNIDLREAETLSFVRDHTHIPVPIVIRQWTSDGIHFLLMEKVRGVRLHERWVKMKEDEKKKVSTQMGVFIRDMRKIRKGELVFTHGDLIPLNIIVDPISLSVAAVVDWETCSFAPPDAEINAMENNLDCPNDWGKLISDDLQHSYGRRNPFPSC